MKVYISDTRANPQYDGEKNKLKSLRNAMFSHVLSEDFGCDETAALKNKYGKPYIPGSDIDFSITHSTDVCAIAVSDKPVGIDIEKKDRVKNIDGMLRFFSDEEKARIEKADNKADEFLRIWTYREAFSKEEGVGLTLYTKENIVIDYEKNRVLRNGRTLNFFEVYYDDYLLTICSEDEIQPMNNAAKHIPMANIIKSSNPGLSIAVLNTSPFGTSAGTW